MKYMLFILMFFVIIGCKQKEVQKFENGNVKLEVETKKGRREGTMYEYFQSGALLAESTWKKDLLHGIVKRYYPNGNLSSEEEWVMGKQTGFRRGYYQDGSLKFKGQYIHNKPVGENVFYYEDGALMEKQLYDQDGKLLNFYKYDRNGKQRLDVVQPIYYLSPDTVHLGENIDLEIRIGNRVYEEVAVLIGTHFDDSENVGLKDTTAILESDNYVYHYSFTPKNIGSDSLSGIVYHINLTDSLEYLEEFSFTLKYYVEE